MHTFRLPDEVRTVLFLGAHADDIEIGCGGTALDLIARRPDVVVHWVVFSADGARGTEARDSAIRLVGERHASRIAIRQFRDGFFPYAGAEIKEAFEELKRSVAPDIVFTHTRADRHQDHRVVSDLTWNTWRNHLVLEYEVPKYDGDLGNPNCFVPLSEEIVERKIRHVCAAFPSQASKHWFTDETFRGLLRLRGVEAGESTRYAEAFYARKFGLTW